MVIKNLIVKGKKITIVVLVTTLLCLGTGAWINLPDVRAAVQSQKEQVHWGYEGAHRPDRWGQLSPEFALCDEGSRQSPIDISQTTPKPMDEIVFSYRPSSTDPLNNGHTIEVQYDRGSYVVIDGQKYNLLQYHFHDPSEHTYKGQHYAAELHLVHQNSVGEFAVIGVLFKIGKNHPTLELFLKNFPVYTGTQTHIPHDVNAEEFLPPSRQYYRYEGSFTTPPCTEGVHWFIMKGIGEFSQEQWDVIQSFIIQGHLEKKVNRPTQPLNGRSVNSKE